jgi:hypothetical protein
VFYPAAVIVMMIAALPFLFQRRHGVGFRSSRARCSGSRSSHRSAVLEPGVLNDWPALFRPFPLVVFIAITVSTRWLERR